MEFPLVSRRNYLMLLKIESHRIKCTKTIRKVSKIYKLISLIVRQVQTSLFKIFCPIEQEHPKVINMKNFSQTKVINYSLARTGKIKANSQT